MASRKELLDVASEYESPSAYLQAPQRAVGKQGVLKRSWNVVPRFDLRRGERFHKVRFCPECCCCVHEAKRATIREVPNFLPCQPRGRRQISDKASKLIDELLLADHLVTLQAVADAAGVSVKTVYLRKRVLINDGKLPIYSRKALGTARNRERFRGATIAKPRGGRQVRFKWTALFPTSTGYVQNTISLERKFDWSASWDDVCKWFETELLRLVYADKQIRRVWTDLPGKKDTPAMIPGQRWISAHDI